MKAAARDAAAARLRSCCSDWMIWVRTRVNASAVEARMGQRQLQQMHGFGRIFLQGGDGDHQIIALGAGAELDGAVGQRFVEGLGIQVARAFVNHGAGKGGQARLAGRIIGRAGRQRDADSDTMGTVWSSANQTSRLLAQIDDSGCWRRCAGASRQAAASSASDSEKHALHLPPPGMQIGASPHRGGSELAAALLHAGGVHGADARGPFIHIIHRQADHQRLAIGAWPCDTGCRGDR